VLATVVRPIRLAGAAALCLARHVGRAVRAAVSVVVRPVRAAFRRLVVAARSAARAVFLSLRAAVRAVALPLRAFGRRLVVAGRRRLPPQGQLKTRRRRSPDEATAPAVSSPAARGGGPCLPIT
jgi:hypothetical protein